MMTLNEALASGYHYGDTKFQRGYISRKIDQGAQVVHTAGGRRAGELYVLLPSWLTTNYCVRQYLVKDPC